VNLIPMTGLNDVLKVRLLMYFKRCLEGSYVSD
jgi:hypothetical protein